MVPTRTAFRVAIVPVGTQAATWPGMDETIGTIERLVLFTAASPMVLALLLYLFA
jgi:hypothetical protein